MKKITVLILVLSMVLSFSCCNRQSDKKTDYNDENNIVHSPETEAPTEYRTQIDAETLAKAVFSCMYDIQDTGFSIEIGEVLDSCTAEISSDYSAYQETKNEFIASENIDRIENGQYKEYLNNSYIVRINGRILYNPEIPNYYTDNQHIITLLLHFDENDNYVGLGYREVSREFDTCAIQLSIGSIHF